MSLNEFESNHEPSNKRTCYISNYIRNIIRQSKVKGVEYWSGKLANVRKTAQPSK